MGELYRCGYLVNPENAHFKLDVAEQLVAQFKGKHDWSSFCLDNSLNKVRPIDVFEVNKLDLSTHQEFDEMYKNIDIFEFYLRGRSFLFGQVITLITDNSIDTFHLDPKDDWLNCVSRSWLGDSAAYYTTDQSTERSQFSAAFHHCT